MGTPWARYLLVGVGVHLGTGARGLGRCHRYGVRRGWVDVVEPLLRPEVKPCRGAGAAIVAIAKALAMTVLRTASRMTPPVFEDLPFWLICQENGHVQCRGANRR